MIALLESIHHAQYYCRERPGRHPFLQNLYISRVGLFIMSDGTVTRGWKKGHLVPVAANVRFVPAKYDVDGKSKKKGR